jgi:hypothetical protein
LDRPGPMEVTEGPSALEVATAENLDPKNGVSTYPAPKDVAGDDLVRVGNARHCLGMDSDRIRMKMDSNVTIYHILIRIRIRIRILSDTNTKPIVRIRIYIRILT